MKLLKNFGIKGEHEVLLPGINAKMNEIQALAGILNLDLVAEERQKRKKILELYQQNLEGIKGISFLEFPKNSSNSYQYLPIFIEEKRDEICQKLRENSIIARKYFYPLCSNYECYKDLESAKKEKLPVANKKANQVLCLPFYGDLAKDDVDRICKLIST